MEIFSLTPEKLIPFIDRIRKFDIERYEDYLHSILLSTLSELADFVPSEGGLVLVDDPLQKRENRTERELTYLAAFGRGTAGVIGKRVQASAGLIGEAYHLGKSIVRKADPTERIVLDRVHFSTQLQNIICVPLKMESSVVGAFIVFNKKDPIGFTVRDLKLVEIFAGYVSTSLQNAIDARKSKELSKRDDLTGLFNDRYFHRQLEIEVVRADEKRYPLSLMFLDLDNFKAINDQHGHLVGSQTLKEVGFLIREGIDYEQATIARYGGDEYVAILPGIDLERAVDMSDRIRLMIAGKLFMIDQGEHDGSFINIKGVISASIGVASLQDHVPSGGTSKDRKNLLIRLADQAMYRAKDQGKNRVCVGDPSKLKV